MSETVQIPKGWELKKLGDVCEPSQYGYTSKLIFILLSSTKNDDSQERHTVVRHNRDERPDY